MTSRTRAELSRTPSLVSGQASRSPRGRCGVDRSTRRQAVLVLLLTPALILFMSRKDVGHAASKPGSAIRQAERWPASGFDGMYRAAHPRWFATSSRYDDSRSANVIYTRAMIFAGKYDSRPYWRYPKLEVGWPTDRATADLAIEHLIPCESMGKNINRVDSNGKMSYGILQFQDWDEWEAASGLTGNPDNRRDAIRMAEWAIQNGMVNHWTCAQILKMM
jgi:hypothetical protein